MFRENACKLIRSISALCLLWTFSYPTSAADPLIDAVMAKDKAKVQALIAAGANVNVRDADGLTPLHLAFRTWADALPVEKELVELLLRQRADPNAKDKDGRTPLHNAAWGGHADIAALLIVAGADLFAKETSTGGWIPVQFASLRQHKAAADLLRSSTVSKASNPRALLAELEEQVRKEPDNDTTRGLIVALAKKIKPSPAIPEKAREHFIKARTIAQSSKDAQQLSLAIASLREALKLAPWWGDAYFNLGVTHELAGHHVQAERNFAIFLVAVADEKEAREVQDRIYAVRARYELLEESQIKKYGPGGIGGIWQLKILDGRDVSADPKRWRLTISSNGEYPNKMYQVKFDQYQGCPRATDVKDAGGLISRVGFRMTDRSDCVGDGIIWKCARADYLHSFGNKLYVDNEALTCNGEGVGSIKGKEYSAIYERVD